MMNKKQLQAEAKVLGIKGYSKMSVASLTQAIERHNGRTAPKVIEATFEVSTKADGSTKLTEIQVGQPPTDRSWDLEASLGANAARLRATGMAWRAIGQVAFEAGATDGWDQVKGTYKYADKLAAAAKKEG